MKFQLACTYFFYSSTNSAVDFAQANQVPQAPALTLPVVKPVLDEPAQGVTPINVDNLSAARGLVSVDEELSAFITFSEVKAMQEREAKGLSASFC